MPAVRSGPRDDRPGYGGAERTEGMTMANLNSRLKRLEAKVCAREFNGDVFADIERYAARLEYYEQHGEWPPDMTPDERRQIEGVLQILGKYQQSSEWMT